jgi:hypothetical protein
MSRPGIENGLPQWKGGTLEKRFEPLVNSYFEHKSDNLSTYKRAIKMTMK